MKTDIDIYVSEEDLIENVQKDFAFYYPNLKLQFFKNPHGEMEASAEQDLVMPKSTIAEVAMFHKSGRIDISPNRRIIEVENDFYFRLGLNVQVFRKAGNVWLETTKTDDMTLKEQNAMTKSDFKHLQATVPLDFDLQDAE